MNKQIVYIAYLIVFFVIFNFAYGFTDWIGSWQMWHWYLVLLGGVIAGLLYLKFKQTERMASLTEQICEVEKVRMQLSQLLLFEQLQNLDGSTFEQFLRKVYSLKGFHSIESAPQGSGCDLILWKESEKYILKWFKTAPLMSHLYKEKKDFPIEGGEEVPVSKIREAFGAMKDYEVQADRLLVVSTGFFDSDAQKFALRNGIELINGEDFYYELETLREPITADILDANGANDLLMAE